MDVIDQTDAIIAVGGDGTVSEVTSALFDIKNVLDLTGSTSEWWLIS